MSNLPQGNTSQSTWQSGIKTEVDYWDGYVCEFGALPIGGRYRFDPNLPMQKRPASLLPDQNRVQVLDVGAGPLTCLGKKCEGKQVQITAVDSLADEYAEILAKYQIEPMVRTEKLDAEQLTTRFPAEAFDLVVAYNCIDHTYDPETAVRQMIEVVKSGCYVYLEHQQNEADAQEYSGFHQWNFSMTDEGDFLIGGKSKVINMSEKYQNLATITCEIVDEGPGGFWLVTRMLKK